MPQIIKEHSGLLNVNHKTNHKDFNKIVKSFVDFVFQWEQQQGIRKSGRKIPDKDIKKYKKIGKIILLNLYFNYINFPQQCIAIHRNKNFFAPDTHYGNLGITHKPFTRIIDALFDCEFIDMTTGNHSRGNNKGKSYTSRIIHTDKLIRMFEEDFSFNLMPEEFLSPPKMNIIDVKEKNEETGDYRIVECIKPAKLQKKKTNLKRYNKLLCEMILMECMELNIVVLPIHDGFLIEEHHNEETIKNIMSNAYKTIMKTNHEIKIDVKEKNKTENRELEPRDRNPVNREDPKVEKLHIVIPDLWVYSEETQNEIINSYFKYKEIPVNMLVQRPEDILQY